MISWNNGEFYFMTSLLSLFITANAIIASSDAVSMISPSSRSCRFVVRDGFLCSIKCWNLTIPKASVRVIMTIEQKLPKPVFKVL